MAFIRLFRSAVLPLIRSQDLEDQYNRKLVFYRKLAGYKIEFAHTMLRHFDDLYEQIKELESERVVMGTTNLLIARNGLLCASISNLFFSMEHSCKIACCLANPKFAQKVAKGIPVGHRDVFDVLRNLGRQPFSIDFDALRRIYAYIIKVRMVADYTELFYEELDVSSFLDLVVSSASEIFKFHKELLFECAGV